MLMLIIQCIKGFLFLRKISIKQFIYMTAENGQLAMKLSVFRYIYIVEIYFNEHMAVIDFIFQ